MVLVKNMQEFDAEARRFAVTLEPVDASARIVTLSGDLGAGKTTFVQAVADALGVQDRVASPTFVIEKIYELPVDQGQSLPAGRSGFARLIHIDAYRLKSGGELEALGWGAIAADPRNLILLEWPERVAEILSPSSGGFTAITLTPLAGEEREIIYG